MEKVCLTVVHIVDDSFITDVTLYIISGCYTKNYTSVNNIYL